jgi:WD40 repeat protein
MQRLAFSPDSKRLAAGTEEGAIRFLDLAAGTDAEMPAHNARVRAVAFSPDGALLASGSADAKVRVHDVASGRRLAALELPTVANNVAFAADGKTLGAVCDAPDSGLHLWDVSTPAAPRHLRQIPAHRGNVHGLAFSPTVPLVATRGIDGFVHLWDWSRAAPCVASLDTGDAEAHDHGVAFAPDGRYLALTHESGAISVVRLPAP